MKRVRARLRNLALRRKLQLMSALTTGVALLAALVALAWYELAAARPRMVLDLASRMTLVALNLDVDLNFADRDAATRTLAALRASADIDNACLFDANRRFFARYGRGAAPSCRWTSELSTPSHRFHGDLLSMSAPVVFKQEVVGYLQVDYALAPLAQRLRQYGLVMGVVLLTLSVGSLMHAFGLRRLVTDPLLALSQLAQRVTLEQRYDLRMPVAGGDEVGRLAAAFNAMLGTVEARDAALRRSQSLLHNIVEKSTAIIYVKDLEGRFLMVNEHFRLILPPGAPDPIGHHDSELFGPEVGCAVNANDHSVLAAGMASTYEEQVPDGGGALRTYISSKFPLFDERGQAWALCGVSTDITDRKKNEDELAQYRDRLEELVAVRSAQMVEANRGLEASLATLQLAQDELVRSEKLAALGALVAGVAHELNTPIGNSLLAVSTLVDQTRQFKLASAHGVKRSALLTFVDEIGIGSDIVLRNLTRAIDLVGSFKQVAVDRTSAQRRAFNLGALMGEILLVLTPTLKHSGIQVRHEIAPEIAMDSYPGPLGQVMINLIENARIHAFEQRTDGDIWITARAVTPGWIELCVCDNGAGIAHEHVGRVYDPFFTTKLGKGGSGLGLHIVYNIVHGVLGGKIEVDSAVGNGTRFILTLPLKA
jgi:PAS domain S-box-containing protein